MRVTLQSPGAKVNPRHFRVVLALAVALLTVTLSGVGAPKADYGSIELIRDTWGIPHVFSATDAGAMYGLGYATAEERGFQMTYSLRIIQGRLAEIVGERPRGNRTETSAEHDRRIRTFGWARAAERTAANLDRDTQELLLAYCEGVNDGFAVQKADGRLHPLFGEMGVTPEPWTPADCLLSWWHLAQFFATDGTRDLMVWRNRAQPRPRSTAAAQAQSPLARRRRFGGPAAQCQRGLDQTRRTVCRQTRTHSCR